MVKRPGATHYEPIDWDDAFELIGSRAARLASPDEAIFYTSGRASNESAFAYQLFVRAFGTNNLPDCSNMCHESTSIALQESIGIGKASVSIEDVYHAEADHPGRPEPGHQSPADAVGAGDRQAERRQDRLDQPAAGGRAGPVQEPAGGQGDRRQGHRARRPAPADQAERRPGAVPGASARCWCEWDALDHDFIDRHTTGFEQWGTHVSAVDWDVVDRDHRTDPRADHRGRTDAAATPTPPCSAGRWV